jgi:hypothetical protein
MNTCSALMLALATGGLILAMPARAADDLPTGAFLLARADTNDVKPGKESRRTARRPDDGERAYGYGFERRQRADRPDDVGGRDRREVRDARSERTERTERSWRGEERPVRRIPH